MNKLQVFYQKKGSIENEHDLLIFVINEGLHQISQELLGFFVYNKFIPPELFLTKKVIKYSLIQINIPIFRRAFVFRRKWVKNVFLTEKFFLHICSLIRCDETFAEGLYFMKKISQKKQRSSAPLWYTENVIELFEEVKLILKILFQFLIDYYLDCYNFFIFLLFFSVPKSRLNTTCSKFTH